MIQDVREMAARVEARLRDLGRPLTAQEIIEGQIHGANDVAYAPAHWQKVSRTGMYIWTCPCAYCSEHRASGPAA